MLEIKNLHVCFYKQDLFLKPVEGLSFTIRKGEIFALIGESGCGKTVTAFSILGLLMSRPGIINGKIIYKGQNLLEGLSESCVVRSRNSEIILVRKNTKWDHIFEERMKAIRGSKIAMIFQEPMSSLDPYYTVGEQISETLFRWRKCEHRQQARELGEDWLNRVSIKNPSKIYGAYPHELSGGMAQRVMIALALCSEPELLIADEPATALDATIRNEIIRLLINLQQAMELPILFITHDISLVKQFATRLGVMYQGRLVDCGTKKEIFGKDMSGFHPFTKRLLTS